MNPLKRTGVAVLLTVVMIVAAVVIGLARRPGHNLPAAESGASTWYVSDQAGVLSSSAIRQLQENNRTLDSSMGVVIGCITCNYGKNDLYNYAMDQAEKMGLGANDFVVVLDISGENYWLIQGSGLVDLFTDDDCAAYAWEYMEQPFAQGDYSQALLSLSDALTQWYESHYLG
ncbi:MAG TPA: TPM domain-containing protein [Candidatus Enterenecus avicola]|nr:TPM domain-containing protein [Candidatus Enterenecus avicola]